MNAGLPASAAATRKSIWVSVGVAYGNRIDIGGVDQLVGRRGHTGAELSADTLGAIAIHVVHGGQRDAIGLTLNQLRVHPADPADTQYSDSQITHEVSLILLELPALAALAVDRSATIRPATISQR